MKVCLCVFSTNRMEYLGRTLVAQTNLDFTGCEVTKILFDDFPKGRDDHALIDLAACHGYNEMFLHGQNMGIGATWEQFWSIIRDRDYDYVLQMEDDVVVLEPVSVMGMIGALKAVPAASQVVLKRQPWYPHEKNSCASDTDLLFPGFRGEFTEAQVYFTPICSLYPMTRVRFDYRAWYAQHYPSDQVWQITNVNEAMIGKALLENDRLLSLHLKNPAGGHIIEHIGEYTQGLKMLAHEPGAARFACFDPEKRYDSKNGQLVTA